MTITDRVMFNVETLVQDGNKLAVAVRKTNAEWRRKQRVLPKFDVISYTTARRYAKTDFKLLPKKERRPESDRLKKRREGVDKLPCIIKNLGGGKKCAKYSTASQVLAAIHKDLALNPRTGRKVVKRTIQRDVRRVGRSCRVRAPVPTRCRRDYERRKVWRAEVLARLHAKKNDPKKLYWKKLMFSDEVWISTKENTGKYQLCKKGQKPYPREVKNPHSLKRFHVFGCCWYGGHSKLVIFPKTMLDDNETVRGFTLNSEKYIRKCLSTIAVFREEHLQDQAPYVFFQDGASCHTSIRVKEYSKAREFPVLQNCPLTPETNMQEHIWAAFHRLIGEKNPTTLAELRAAALEVWDSEAMQKEMDAACSGFEHAVVNLDLGE